jgi:hypothetical protein
MLFVFLINMTIAAKGGLVTTRVGGGHFKEVNAYDQKIDPSMSFSKK